MTFSHSDNNLFRIRIGILIIMIAGFFVRAYHLGTPSLGMDEGYSVKVAQMSFSQIVAITSSDVHPPLYYILLHYWILFLGSSEFSVRFMSVIFAVLAILMIYKVGNLIYDKDVGLLSALILAFSIYHIHYSQEARMYSQAVSFTLVSMFYMIKHKREGKLIFAGGYIISAVCLIYSHVYGLFILAAQNIYMLTRFLLDRSEFKPIITKWLLLQFATVIAFIPWISAFMSQIIRVHSGFWIPTPPIRKIATPFFMYSGSWALFTFFVLLLCLSASRYMFIKDSRKWGNHFRLLWRRHRTSGFVDIWKLYFLLVWLLVPIVLPFLISRFFTPILMTRYTLVVSPAFYLLIAKAIQHLASRNIRTTCIIVIILLSLFNVHAYYKSVNKPLWREVAIHLNSSALDTDLIILHEGYSRPVFNYYFKKPKIRQIPFPQGKSKITDDVLKNLDDLVRDYTRVWLILAYGKGEERLIIERLNKHYTSIYHRKYLSYAYALGRSVSIDVFLFQKNGTAGGE